MTAPRTQPVLAAIAAVSFGFIIASSNSINPLLPLLRVEIPMTPITVSLTFVVYVSSAVIALLAVAMSPRTLSPAATLIVALGIATVSNVLLAQPTAAFLLAGRAGTGFAVGLATGSAAGLVVHALLGKGRGLAATGNLLGAVVGASIAQGVATLNSVGAVVQMYLIAAAVAAGLCLALIALTYIRARTPRPQASVRPPRRDVRWNARSLRVVAGAALAWTALSAGVVYAPLLFSDADMHVAQVVGSVAMLAAAAGAQLSTGVLARVAGGSTGYLLPAAGIFFTAASILLRSDAIGITALIVAGAGGALAYRTALVALTTGSGPTRQMIITSKFAVITYTASAFAILAIGLVNAALPLHVVLAGAGVILAAGAVIFSFRAPRLRGAA